jgi:alpha-L-rhamnosidase
MMKHLFLCFAASLVFAVAAHAIIEPVKTTCEYLEDPLGIETQQPRFGWILQSQERNQKQHAYEIIVSFKPEDIWQGRGTVWSSGKILSSENIHVVYNGQPLQSFTRYYWSVRVYDQDGLPSHWSRISSFETAMLNSSDWEAAWISDGSKPFERDEDFYQDDAMPLFKKSFKTSRKIERARLYISGIGYYEAYLNGKKIGDHVLDPGWTTYSKEVLYVVHDITNLLSSDAHVLSIMLGNGWYNPLPLRLFSRFNLRDWQETGRPCLKAEVHIHYSDGSSEKILTDDTWETAPGPVIRNSVYLGECYDARREQKDWFTPRQGVKPWKKASVVQGPSGGLHVQMQPPIKITTIVKPISIKELKPGVFIADMGQNFAGVARIRVKGKAGTEIKLKYGEDIHPDGSLNYYTTTAGQIKSIWNINGGPGAPADAWQEDRYTLKGSGTEVWSPRFTFHGFRYIEITGWPGKPDLHAIEGLRMNSDLQRRGEFSCSNTMFNTLHEAIQWTFLSNVFSIQSDCPGREKMGYGADMVATSDAFIYNFDMTHFYRKAVEDFANEQRPEGGITEIAPFTGIADRGYGAQSGPLGWQLAFPYLQKELYMFYGDKQVIRDHYEAVKKQMEFLELHATNGLFHWDIGDHEALDPRPEAFSASAFYYHHAVLASEFAAIMDLPGDVEKYSKLAKQIRELIIKKYLVPNTGRFDNATQSAQLFALWYNLSPEREKTFDVLMDEFKRHNYHVSSGIFGVKMMFDVLREENHNDIAYRIANQRDFPGWGYMLERGATTLWETWAYPDNAPSQNHPMFGSIDEWFYRSLLGINPAAAGFEKIVIKPMPVSDLAWAKGSYACVRGVIESEWRLENGKYRLNINIPPNTTATVWVRTKEGGTITESGKAVTPLIFEDGYAKFETGSGKYAFESTLE